MRITLAYVAVTRGPITADYCARFVASYLLYPPGLKHETIVICNGGPLSVDLAALFLPIEAEFMPRTNDLGWDISAYQDAAARTDADLLLCCGESVFFHQPGWLLRIALAYERFGPGMYGCFSSFLVRPHLNTTCFAISPSFLRTYPRVKDHRTRYEFEHGERSIWHHVVQRRGVAKLVTFDGVYDPPQWRMAKNILWRGDQSNCLVFCNHVERYESATPESKKKWEAGADTMRLRDPMITRLPVRRAVIA